MATTKEQNERLTQIGPGTPMGNLLRRYWQPVGLVPELAEDAVQRVRVLGEDLTLFRSESGEYGLIAERCPHRGVSLDFGIPDERGLRCCYHGWLFSPGGACIEQPYEDRTHPEARFREKIRITAYPVQELGGMLFAYLGPEPAPLLPHWDLLVRDDVDRVVEVHRLPCNWLQCMDNAADPIHFEYLHAIFGNYQLKKQGRAPKMHAARHLKIEFDVFRFGIMKRRLLEGAPEDSEDWTVGHPLIFPNLLAVGGTVDGASLQYRVPVDDTTTMQFAYRTLPRKADKPSPMVVKRTDFNLRDGRIVADTIPSQDVLAWVAQGPINDRASEHLASSDVGVILYHKMLVEEMAKVERGEEPMGLIWDPADNEPWVKIRREETGMQQFQASYDNYFERLQSLAESH